MEPLKSTTEADQVLHFREFIQQFVQQFQPLQIYSFSQNSYSQHPLGCFRHDKSSFKCNYCLLVVMDTASRIDYQMQDFANTHYQQGTITTICHGQQSIIDAVQNNNRFFTSVLSRGKLLYNKDGMLDAGVVPAYIPTKGAIKATQHYEHRIALAEGFLLCASECLQKDRFGICAFMLHQAVEQCCICLIRVHISYRSEFHNLYRLLHLCQSFSERPFQLFLSNPDDERLFEVMAKSYSGSRYKDDFKVSRQDVERLYRRVESFVVLAKEMCHEKIQVLEHEAALYATLKSSEVVQVQRPE